MTEPANMANDTAPPRDRITLALLGVVAAFALLDMLGTWFAPVIDDRFRYFEFFCAGIMAFQPITFGIWTALGPGPFIARFVSTVPLLALLCVMPGYVPEAYSTIELREFLIIAAVGYGMYFSTTGVFFIVRRFGRLRLASASTPNLPPTNLNFSIKQLLALTTIYAIVLGFATGLQLKNTPPSPNALFGPMFFFEIATMFGATGFAVTLPTTVAGLAILYGALKPAVALSASAFWLLIMVAIIGLTSSDTRDVAPAFGILSLVSLGALTAGVATAVLLRLAGLRLIRLYAADRNPTAASEAAAT